MDLMKKFFINKKQLDRHKILEVLQKKMSEGNHPNRMLGDVKLTFQMLLSEAGIPEKRLLTQLDYLSVEEEISIEEGDSTMHYMVLRKGTVAYGDDKYIRMGWNNFLENTYNLQKVLIAAAVLISYLYAFTVFINPIMRNLKEIVIELNRAKTDLPINGNASRKIKVP